MRRAQSGAAFSFLSLIKQGKPRYMHVPQPQMRLSSLGRYPLGSAGLSAREPCLGIATGRLHKFQERGIASPSAAELAPGFCSDDTRQTSSQFPRHGSQKECAVYRCRAVARASEELSRQSAYIVGYPAGQRKHCTSLRALLLSTCLMLLISRALCD